MLTLPGLESWLHLGFSHGLATVGRVVIYVLDAWWPFPLEAQPALLRDNSGKEGGGLGGGRGGKVGGGDISMGEGKTYIQAV